MGAVPPGRVRRGGRIPDHCRLAGSGGDWTLNWNGENRRIAADSSPAKLEFKYDLGRRVERKTHAGTTGNWTGSETRRFLYNGWNLIAEFTVDGETTSLDRSHAWGLDLSLSSQRGRGEHRFVLRIAASNGSQA